MGSSGLFVLLIFVSVITIFVWFNVNMSSAMNAVSQENRILSGGLVWLNILPIMNLIWPFIFNSALKNSYIAEFKSKRITKEVNLNSGIIYPIMPLLLVFLSFYGSALFSDIENRAYQNGYYNQDEILGVSFTIGIIYLIIVVAGFIFQIVFWANVIQLKNTLVESTRLNSTILDDQNYQSNLNNFSNNNVEFQQRPIVEPIIEVKEKTEKNPIESSIDKLKKYHDMLNEGLINQYDFDRIKKEILNNNK
jgi:hypothetical protein